MTKRILLLTAIALPCFVSFLAGQVTTEKKMEIVKYPLPGSEDTVGEVKTAQQRKVLDDFYQSKVAELDTPASRMADQGIFVSERFGIGERITKEQIHADSAEGRSHMLKFKHDHIRLVAFGNNIVVMTGRSMSSREQQGKVFNGPRLFSFVWAKLDGRMAGGASQRV